MTVKIDGLDAIFKKLDSLGKPEVFKRPMRLSAERVQDRIAKYPLESAANRPPGPNGYSWYVRGYGTRTRTGRGYPTSKDLGPSWTVKYSNGHRRAEIGNNASYGKYVQDKDEQAGWHKGRWHTIQDVVKKQTPAIIGFFKAAYDKAVKT